MADDGIATYGTPEWDAKQDAELLMKAHQIKSDPKRHKAAHAHAKKMMAHMQGVFNMDNGNQSGKGNNKGD